MLPKSAKEELRELKQEYKEAQLKEKLASSKKEIKKRSGKQKDK